jgi:amidophosphoribosyltransferase
VYSEIIEDDKLHEECGVFGITGVKQAAAHTILGLHALQHRGQEGAGVVTFDNGDFRMHHAFGKVGDNFSSPEILAKLSGKSAIGHNRYSTSGSKANSQNLQPIYAELSYGGLAVAHNGNLTNADVLRKELVTKGSIFRTTMDTEVILHLVAVSEKPTVKDALIEALEKVRGAYSLVALTEDSLIGVRDPHGIRPLVLGRLEGAWVITSETCALDIIGADYIRDVEAGEMVTIKDGKLYSEKPFKPVSKRFCIFEYIYFARPDSLMEGVDVYTTRKKLGAQLAKDSPALVDIIVPVPDSGVPAALGYSEESGIPLELGIIRNHYVGRTFIEPSDNIRHLGVKLKHNPNRSVIDGKKVLLIDDSIVRGTTSKKIVDMVRAAGAKEVHMRISSPPTTNSCFYGVDTPEQSKLLAHQMNIKEMERFIGVDSLSFLTVDGLYQALGEKGRDKLNPQYCDACFTGDYPVAVKSDN